MQLAVADVSPLAALASRAVRQSVGGGYSLLWQRREGREANRCETVLKY